MAMNSPSSPIEATRNASMITGVLQARDRQRINDSLDERERDRLAQEQREIEFNEIELDFEKPGLFRRLRVRLPF